MLKEIHEQPQAIADTLAGRLRDDGAVDLAEIDLATSCCAACAASSSSPAAPRTTPAWSAAYAHRAARPLPVEVDLASEFRYRDPVLDADTLVIGITQSGETPDTLAAMRLAREAGAPVLALTNIMGSQATREADAVLLHPRRPRDRRGGHQDPSSPRSPPCCCSPRTWPAHAAP